MKNENEKCSVWDAALKYGAGTMLKRGNAVICVCVHCRAQGRTPGELQHTPTCCFSKHINRRKHTP